MSLFVYLLFTSIFVPYLLTFDKHHIHVFTRGYKEGGRMLQYSGIENDGKGR